MSKPKGVCVVIEIVSRWDKTKVLYRAETAQNVRSAVTEAAEKKANLSGANLSGADLGDANLSGADLGDADLGGASDPRSPLHLFRQDLWAVLDEAPAEVAGLRQALVEGKVDGSTYTGRCACLVGTLAQAHTGAPIEDLDGVLAKWGVDLRPRADRPAEQWFLPIREGDRAVEGDPPEAWPSEGVFRASLAVGWVDEWRASRERIAGVLAR